MSTKVVSTHAQ